MICSGIKRCFLASSSGISARASGCTTCVFRSISGTFHMMLRKDANSSTVTNPRLSRISLSLPPCSFCFSWACCSCAAVITCIWSSDSPSVPLGLLFVSVNSYLRQRINLLRLLWFRPGIVISSNIPGYMLQVLGQLLVRVRLYNGLAVQVNQLVHPGIERNDLHQCNPQVSLDIWFHIVGRQVRCLAFRVHQHYAHFFRRNTEEF